MSRRTRTEKELILNVIAGEDGREIVPTVMDEDILERAAQRQGRAMIRSLAHEMAHAEGQARLDGFRAKQTLRVGQATQRPAAEAMAEVAEQGRRMAEAHPAVADAVAEMTNDVIDVFRQIPKLAAVAYSSRYFDMRRNRCRRPGDC